MKNFLEACRNAETISDVKLILEKHDPNSQSESNPSENFLLELSQNDANKALLFACYQRDFVCAEFLFVKHQKHIPRHYLAECLRYSCDNETMVDLINQNWYTPNLEADTSYSYKATFSYGLACACETGNIKGARLMIQKGASDLNLRLIDACQRNCLEIVELLINSGATNLNEALEHSTYNGKLQFVEFLFSKCKFNQSVLNVCLTYACKINCIEIAKLFLENGANNFEALSGKHIYALLQMGLPIETFSNFRKYQLILNELVTFQKNIREHSKDCLIPELLMLVSEYCIW